MLGLEYIARVFKMSYTDIAKEIGVTPQYVQSWVSIKDGKPRRNISKANLEKLSKLFGLPEDFFQKELNRVEMVDVQIAYYRKLAEEEGETVTIPQYDRETGEYYEVEEFYNPYHDILWKLNYRRNKEIVLLETEKLLFEQFETNDNDDELDEFWKLLDGSAYTEVLERVNKLFKKKSDKHIEVLQLLLELFFVWGKPRVNVSDELINDMRMLLKKHNIVFPISSKVE
jgi:transcriptional regulator with XRE-family HTH domain